MQACKNEDLYKNLLELSIIDQKELESDFDKAQKENLDLGEVLLDRDLITDENLGKIISDVINVPFISLSKVSIPGELLTIVPELVARKQKVIVFGKDTEGLKIATLNPKNQEELDFIAKKTGEKIQTFYATNKDIELALGLYKKDLQKSFDELLKAKISEAGNAANSDAPVSEIVDLLINYAYSNRASDVHVEPEKTQSLIRFRIDGVLHDVLHFPKKIHDQIVSKVKVSSHLKTDEHLSAQDGKMQIPMPDEDLDIRVSIVPITAGEKIVLRLLSSKSRELTLSDLGMREADLLKVREGFNKPYGMVLSTGPTGSGKTTSIYAVLKILNTREINIATIEDPVEYEIAGINQIQVNAKTNLTFASGLRAILRQDPNIIFVGEIRDGETADIAINSAMTGHMVLSTLHTNDAATTLPRLIDMGIEPFLVASTINVIIGQRLVRKICQSCRFSVTVKCEELAKQLPLDLVKKQFGENEQVRIYQGKGCLVCHQTGYINRVGIFEVLTVNKEIKELIINKADSNVITEKARILGMTTMLEDGLDKVSQGVTTIEEILRVTKG